MGVHKPSHNGPKQAFWAMDGAGGSMGSGLWPQWLKSTIWGVMRRMG